MTGVAACHLLAFSSSIPAQHAPAAPANEPSAERRPEAGVRRNRRQDVRAARPPRGRQLHGPHALAAVDPAVGLHLRAVPDRPDRGAPAVRGPRPARAATRACSASCSPSWASAAPQPRWPRPRSRCRAATSRVMMVGWGAGTLPLAAVGIMDSFWALAAALFIFGATGGMGMVIWGTLLQRRVPRAPAGPRLQPGLLRLAGPDAGLHGPRRTRRGGAADLAHLPGRRDASARSWPSSPWPSPGCRPTNSPTRWTASRQPLRGRRRRGRPRGDG